MLYQPTKICLSHILLLVSEMICLTKSTTGNVPDLLSPFQNLHSTEYSHRFLVTIFVN